MGVLHELEQLGQSIWYDNISRGMVRRGDLRSMVAEGLLGVTSNPSIFEKAITGSDEYDAQIRSLLTENPSTAVDDLIRALMVEDIRHAADDLRSVYDRTGKRDGYVSVEVSPSKARDTEGTLAEARQLWRMVDRPNVMVKIPATREGLPAIEQAVAEGLNINVTLIFSLERYREVADAYMRGLERRGAAGEPLAHVASVASVFVSRIDTLVDAMLDDRAGTRASDAGRLHALRGKAAVANTKMIYQAFREISASPRFSRLKQAGARVQRPLWGSTSTKNPAYSDLMYVAPLVGPDTVNTVPPVTYVAILDHLRPSSTIENDLDGARGDLAALRREGITMEAVTAQLEEEGVAAFSKSFDGLSASLLARVARHPAG